MDSYQRGYSPGTLGLRATIAKGGLTSLLPHDHLPPHAQATPLSRRAPRAWPLGRAADACLVSQSTLSAGLRDLEGLLGVVLVERSKRSVRFTPLGDAVVAKAHRILREAEELSDLVQQLGPTTLRRSADERDPDHRPVPAAARCCPACGASGPALKLFLREEASAAAIESLHHGRADCVLLALPYRHRRGREGDHRARRLLRRLPPGRSARSARRSAAQPDRREPAAAARRRPLPERPCARRLQPPGTARRARR